MTKQEQLATYQEILKDAQAENEKLRAELKELQARLAPPPSAAPAQMP
jgi:BMFP domain-containing protein YqiC